MVLAAGVLANRMATQADEATLIRAAQRGEAEAFETLVRTYDQNVLRIAMNLLRSPEDARDIYPSFHSAEQGSFLHVITLESEVLNRQHSLRMLFQLLARRPAMMSRQEAAGQEIECK